jgi:hypothetical protein
MKRRTLVAVALAMALVIGEAVPALAADPHTQGIPGQPSQSCQAVFPSGPLVPPGFNTSGFANAEAHYAGSQPQNSRNPKSVAQYDVACFQHQSR